MGRPRKKKEAGTNTYTFRIPDEMKEAIEEYVRTHQDRYFTTSEFIREAIRDKLNREMERDAKYHRGEVRPES